MHRIIRQGGIRKSVITQGVIFLIMTLLCKEGYGDLSSAYTKGTAFSTSKQEDVTAKASSAKTSDIPGFKGTSSGSSFDEKSLGESAASAASRHDVSLYIAGHARNRKNFTINPEKDPMVVNANKAVLDPIKTMGEVVIDEEEKKEHEGGREVTCLEGGQEFTKVCMKTLEIELKITPEISHMKKVNTCSGHDYRELGKDMFNPGGYDYCDGSRSSSCSRLEKVITQHRKVEIVREEWVDTCKGLEANADKGICRYVSAEHGNEETRTLQGEVIEKEAKEKKTYENEPITRDHWWERYTYACLKESGDGCASLKARGCVQKRSVCVETVGGVCVQWKQTYQCPSSKKTRKRYKLKGDKSPFCMTGNCVDASYEGNTELFDAMSHLYVLREAQKDMGTDNISCLVSGSAMDDVRSQGSDLSANTNRSSIRSDVEAMQSDHQHAIASGSNDLMGEGNSVKQHQTYEQNKGAIRRLGERGIGEVGQIVDDVKNIKLGESQQR